MLSVRYALERQKLAALETEYAGDYAHPVFGEGNEKCPVIMFIGEAPGKEEAACGRPFVGKAGKQLDEMLNAAGIDRSAVYVTNAVKYRPVRIKERSVSNRTPSAPEIRGGLELLNTEIEYVQPKVIATLGNVPLSAVLLLAHGVTQELTVGSAHGKLHTFYIGRGPQKVFPLYHPAASIYNRELKPVLTEDLIKLGELCRSIEDGSIL
ncbi:MAG: uracil-DNA glycosylase [Clostridia bacterium]|nr:uracil-DNA glycosylase [Clostridia bacterium]